jgi:hypothetical protein
MVPPGASALQGEPEGGQGAIPLYRLSAGMTGGIHGTWTLGSFTTRCDCAYEHASAVTGFEAGMQAELAFSPQFGAGAALLWSDLSTTYTETEARKEYVVDQGTYVDAEFERSADMTLRYVTLRLSLLWYSGPGGLRVFGGPSLAVPVQAEIHEEERILTSGLRYADTGARERTFLDGDVGTMLANASIRLAMDAGVAYAIPVSVETSVIPFIAFSVPLQDVLKDSGGWKIGSAAAGISLMLRI